MQLKIRAKQIGFRAAIYAVVALDNGSDVLFGDGSGMISHWTIADDSDGQAFAQLPSPVYCLAYCKEAKLVVAGTQSSGIYLFDLDAKKEIAHIDTKTNSVYKIVQIDDRLYASIDNGQIIAFSLAGKIKKSSKQLCEKGVRALAALADGNLLVGDRHGTIHLLNADLGSIQQLAAHQGSIFDLFTSNSTVYSGAADAQLGVSNYSNDLESVASIPAHQSTINSICSVKDRVVTASRDRSIRIWSQGDMELLKVYNKEKGDFHSHSVNCLCYLNDYNWLISGGDDETVLCVGFTSQLIALIAAHDSE